MVCGWGLVGGFNCGFLFLLCNWLIIGVLFVDFQISTFECAYLEKGCVVWWGDIGVCYLVENL